MPARRLRLRLRAWRVRVSRSVGYWWLEQRELSGGRRRPFRRARLLPRRVTTAVGDRWDDLTDGVRRRGRRLRHAARRARRGLTRPFRRGPGRQGGRLVALLRRGSRGLATAVVETSRAVVTTPASGVEWVGGRVARAAGASVAVAARGGRGVQGGLARATTAARTGTSRGGRSVGTALATTAAATRAGASRGARGIGGRLARVTTAARTGTSRGGRSVGTALATAAAAVASACGAATRAVVSTPAAGVAWLGSTGRRVALAPTARWVAATAVLVVVGGAVVAAVRDEGAGRDAAERTEASQAGSPARDAVAGSGPGFTSPGIHLSVSPEGSGELGVVERVETRHPVRVLPLAAPPPESDTSAPTSRLVDLSVVADGVAVPLDGVGEIAQEQQVRLPRAASSFELRYRVVGAEERSPLAPPGRATLSLRPAATALVPAAPAVVEVRDAVVHTLVCLDAPRAEQLCGVDDPDGWHTEQVTAATSRVLALVDLPPT